jgi:dihydrofolate synthase/folylpolyglutamate synthase
LPREPFGRFTAASARRSYTDLAIQLGGAHQVTNALTALAALETAEQHGVQVDLTAVRAGLAAARWPGRLEVVQTAPLVVIDGAHNGDSAARLVEALHLHFDYDRLHVLLGVFADKDLAAILRPFREAASLRAVELSNPRARPAAEVAAAARSMGIAASEGGSVGRALESALAEAERRDLVVATGSLAVVAEALRERCAPGAAFGRERESERARERESES